MRKLITVLTLVTLLTSPAIAAYTTPEGWFGTDVKEGVFYCVTEYVVGVQKMGAEKRIGKAYQVDDEHEKFTMKIGKVTGLSPEMCGDINSIDKLLNCNDSYEAVTSFDSTFYNVRGPSVISRFISMSGEAFVNMGNRFRFVVDYDEGPVMFEGTCTAF